MNTEKFWDTYIENRLARYITFHSAKDLVYLDAHSIGEFLEHLVVRRGVSSSTQSQALCALIFFYKNVLEQDIGHFTHSKKPRRLPVVRSNSKKVVRDINRHW